MDHDSKTYKVLRGISRIVPRIRVHWGVPTRDSPQWTIKRLAPKDPKDPDGYDCLTEYVYFQVERAGLIDIPWWLAIDTNDPLRYQLYTEREYEVLQETSEVLWNLCHGEVPIDDITSVILHHNYSTSDGHGIV